MITCNIESARNEGAAETPSATNEKRHKDGEAMTRAYANSRSFRGGGHEECRPPSRGHGPGLQSEFQGLSRGGMPPWNRCSSSRHALAGVPARGEGSRTARRRAIVGNPRIRLASCMQSSTGSDASYPRRPTPACASTEPLIGGPLSPGSSQSHRPASLAALDNRTWTPL